VCGFRYEEGVIVAQESPKGTVHRHGKFIIENQYPDDSKLAKELVCNPKCKLQTNTTEANGSQTTSNLINTNFRCYYIVEQKYNVNA